MPLDLPTLARWQAAPSFANGLEAFLISRIGQQFLNTLRHEFRAVPMDTPVLPGVDYLQVHALRNASREACQKVIDTIVAMSVVREPRPRLPDEGWATQPLRRDDESPPPETKKKKK